MKPEISIIGCGRVGTALAVFLARAGYPIAALAGRESGSAEKTARAAGQGRVCTDAADAAAAGAVVFITTPDHLIESLCRKICRRRGVGAGRIFFHCSGALSSCILSSATAAGGFVASFHPLQSVAPYETGQPSPFQGVKISAEGHEKAIDMARKIAEDLDSMFFSIPTHAKILYHAAAVMASNYLVTLEKVALSLLQEADLSESAAYDILEPLILGTLNNIRHRGVHAALTGPVARGDADVVQRHLSELEKKRPDCLALYRVMGRYTLDMAEASGKMDPGAAAALSALFKKPS